MGGGVCFLTFVKLLNFTALPKKGTAASKLTLALQRPKGNRGFLNFKNHNIFLYIHIYIDTYTHPPFMSSYLQKCY